MNKIVKFIRYPGGKQRLLNQIIPLLPKKKMIKGNFVEPFVGGGSVYFNIAPKKAILADLNPVLIQLYECLKENPDLIWKYFKKFPSTKKAYYKIRDGKIEKSKFYQAARTLFLNRTCFKGMWRENAKGKFNVGYGGQQRRWVISRKSLFEVSKYLKNAKFRVNDFEKTINKCKSNDFVFLDPPYRPGARELKQSHYVYSKFNFNEYKRLADVLNKSTTKGIKWAMTTSSHKHILKLFKKVQIKYFNKGTGTKPGILKKNPGEVLVYNY